MAPSRPFSFPPRWLVTQMASFRMASQVSPYETCFLINEIYGTTTRVTLCHAQAARQQVPVQNTAEPVRHKNILGTCDIINLLRAVSSVVGFQATFFRHRAAAF